MVRPVLKKSAKNAKKIKNIKTKKVKKQAKTTTKSSVKSKAVLKVKTQKVAKLSVKNKAKTVSKKTTPRKLVVVKSNKAKQGAIDKSNHKKRMEPKAVKKAVEVKKNDVKGDVKNLQSRHHLKQVKNQTVLLKNREANKMKSKVTTQTIEPAHFHPDDYMTPNSQAHFKEILLNWKKQLMGEMEKTVHQMQDEITVFADPNDRATQEEEFSIELRTRDRERKLIKKIEEALDRLSRNDYGYCEDCGVEIGLKRLEARPTATLCIDCKTIEEIREKSSSD